MFLFTCCVLCLCDSCWQVSGQQWSWENTHFSRLKRRFTSNHWLEQPKFKPFSLVWLYRQISNITKPKTLAVLLNWVSLCPSPIKPVTWGISGVGNTNMWRRRKSVQCGLLEYWCSRPFYETGLRLLSLWSQSLRQFLLHAETFLECFG